MSDDRSTEERRREATRWRIAAEWGLPLDRVNGETEDEMNASASMTVRSVYLLPGMPAKAAPPLS